MALNEAQAEKFNLRCLYQRHNIFLEYLMAFWTIHVSVYTGENWK